MIPMFSTEQYASSRFRSSCAKANTIPKIAVVAPIPTTAHPAPAAVPDQSVLAQDAIANYLGGGFLGQPAVLAAGRPTSEALPDVEAVLPASSVAANTYSNPHDRAFGQSAAHMIHPPPVQDPADSNEVDVNV